MKGHGEAHLAAEVADEAEHLGLGRDVEARDDLIGQHEIGFQHHRAGDADALALPARQFVRVAFQRRERQPDLVEGLARQRHGLASGSGEAVQQERRGEDASAIVWRGLSDAMGSWKIICMRRRSGRIAASSRCVMSVPAKRMVPASGRTRPSKARPSVVLPEPDSPTMPTTSPRPIRSETFLTTTVGGFAQPPL